jgi:hypothetical protein
MGGFKTIPYEGQPLSGTNSPQPVALKSGEHFYLPFGTWLVKLAPQCAVQYQDQNSGMWFDWDGGYSSSCVPVESDGTNFRVSNLSGTISGIDITAAGSGYNAATTTATFTSAPTGGVTATGTPIIGGSLSLAIPSGSTGGTGYTKPIIYIPPPWLLGGTPGLCLPATATLGFSSGVINSESMVFAGAGYVTAPGNATQTITPAQFALNWPYYSQGTNMVIIDPTGSGATIAATVGGAKTLTGLVMLNGGAGYTNSQSTTVTITDSSAGGGSGATAVAIPNLALTGVTVAGTNTGYTSTIMFESSLGSGAQAIQPINGIPAQPRPARGTIPESGGVLGTAVIEDAGIGFQTEPILRQVGNATVDGSVNATLTAVCGGVTNTIWVQQIG